MGRWQCGIQNCLS